MIALRGMPSYSASSGSCAMTSPPFSLTAFSPRLPSAPVPERITQIARCAELLRQRAQEEVEGQARAVALPRFGEPQAPSADREIGTRRNEIDMLALERHPVCCLLHLHRRMAGQQIDHHALVRRIEMLDQNEGHAGVGRERVEEPPEGIEAAGRGAEPDDREINTSVRASAMRARSAAAWPASRALRPVIVFVLRKPGFPWGTPEVRFHTITTAAWARQKSET